jgi:iron(III) transport system substrate-binding protein
MSAAWRSRAAVLAAVVGLLGGGCPPPQPIEVTVSSGQGPRALTRDQIFAQARREGEVTFYTSLPQGEAQRLARRFMQQYPFLTCRVVRSGTFEVARRVQAEIDRGQLSADVLHVLDPGVFVALQQGGHLYRYEASQGKYLPPGLRSDGYWYACRFVVTVLACRKGENLRLRRWLDLLTLPATVQLGLKDAETSGSAYATYLLLREKYGYWLWQRLAERRPRIYRSEEEMLAALQRGEVDLLAGVMADTVARAPSAQIIWPADGAPMVVGPVAILAAAAHPNAAKLLVDFLLSHAGQELIRDVTGAYPARPGLAPPSSLRPLDSLPILRPRAPWELYTAMQDYLQAEYRDLFRPGSE